MIHMNRRDFLKGLLAVSAAAALPALPFVADATMPPAPALDLTPPLRYGRLGRIRLGGHWLPLEDASLTMLRRHTPSLLYYPTSMPGLYREVAKSSPLVNSPWQLQIWTPDAISYELFNQPQALDFEIEAHHRIHFYGNGYTSEYGSEVRMEPDAPTPVLFDLILEGDSKLTRYGNVPESDLMEV